ncbi:MAG: HDIG domain-containing protein [Elusimicrobia bacterium]|nr:HDIG domain-containing protein [Elusimicrobiota bacterium]
MLNFVKKIIKKPIRSILQWSEKTSKPTGFKITMSVFKKDIHIPTGVIAIFIYISILVALSFDLSLSLGGVFGIIIFLAVIMILAIVYLKSTIPEFIMDDESVMLTGFATIFIMFLSSALKNTGLPEWAIPAASVSILVTLLISPSVAVVVALVVSISLGILFDFSFSAFSVYFFGSLASIFVSAKAKNRYDLIKIGYYIILTNTVVIVSLSLLEKWSADIFLPSILWGSANGVFSVMIVLSFLPYMERFFSKTTSIRLLELGDFNQPLLKRLMLEAPGSYHHSLMVAALAEPAADVVNANPLLCRVGAYYHDVGKITIPEYFIENESANPSKHKDLKSQMSSFVIISHVKEGVRLAQEYGIDKIIIDIIQQHHGTSLVHYFYMKALANGISDSEKQAYRYPGPCPTTKESAIIMLADSVEAASRTLEDASYPHLREMVLKIVNNKFIDGQFDSSELTLADLHRIAEKFMNVLAGIYHSRIEYQEETQPTDKKKQDADKNFQ